MLFQSRPAKMGILKGCKLGLLPLALCELHLCYRSFQLFGEINWNYLAVFNFSLQPAEYATILVIFFFIMLWNVSFLIFFGIIEFLLFFFKLPTWTFSTNRYLQTFAHTQPRMSHVTPGTAHCGYHSNKHVRKGGRLVWQSLPAFNTFDTLVTGMAQRSGFAIKKT